MPWKGLQLEGEKKKEGEEKEEEEDTGEGGNLADGYLLICLLSARVHLMEAVSVVLKDAKREENTFKSMHLRMIYEFKVLLSNLLN